MWLPCCPPGTAKGAPRLEWQPVEGVRELGPGEGWQSQRDSQTCLCVAAPGTESLATEQAGRQLPLGTEASPFPPCRSDTPSSEAAGAGVW